MVAKQFCWTFFTWLFYKAWFFTVRRRSSDTWKWMSGPHSPWSDQPKTSLHFKKFPLVPSFFPSASGFSLFQSAKVHLFLMRDFHKVLLDQALSGGNETNCYLYNVEVFHFCAWCLLWQYQVGSSNSPHQIVGFVCSSLISLLSSFLPFHIQGITRAVRLWLSVFNTTSASSLYFSTVVEQLERLKHSSCHSFSNSTKRRWWSWTCFFLPALLVNSLLRFFF